MHGFFSSLDNYTGAEACVCDNIPLNEKAVDSLL